VPRLFGSLVFGLFGRREMAISFTIMMWYWKT